MVNIMKITVCLRAAYLTGAGTDGWVCLGTGGRESSPRCRTPAHSRQDRPSINEAHMDRRFRDPEPLAQSPSRAPFRQREWCWRIPPPQSCSVPCVRYPRRRGQRSSRRTPRVTNINDIMTLSLFSARGAGNRGSMVKIVIGRYLGFVVILAIATAAACGAVPARIRRHPLPGTTADRLGAEGGLAGMARAHQRL